MSGNLCRCGAYVNIEAAVLAVAEGDALMPRLVKTEAVIEGRVEERWVLVDDDDTPEWKQDERPPVIGREATRLTAQARVTGTARYTSDIDLPGMLEARVLRSPHANARAGVDRSGRRPRGSRRALRDRPRRHPASTTAMRC